MTEITNRFDPWGPISTALYEINDSDFVQDAIGNTGVDVNWRPLTTAEAYSHSTRIRAFRRDIEAAYSNLEDDQKGLFAQIVVKSILRRNDGDERKQVLNDRLSDIGWTVTDDEGLKTEDALISEQFFPPNSEYDAYCTIRDILATARNSITVVDAYLGPSLLVILGALGQTPLSVRLLTGDRNLRDDFVQELASFQQQHGHIAIELRTSADFHDRFIVIDDSEFYHVGASIKDAGRRAFMISPIQDRPNIDGARDSIEQSWAAGSPLQP